MGHAGIGVKAHKSWPIPLVADEMRVPIQIEHLVASAASVWLQTQDSDADAGTNTGKSDGGKTCAKAFVHCGILKPVKA